MIVKYAHYITKKKQQKSDKKKPNPLNHQETTSKGNVKPL